MASLAPPQLRVDTRHSRSGDGEQDDAIAPSPISSSHSNPFLTPAISSSASMTSATTTVVAAAVEDPDSALRPDPGTEADFVVDDNPFAFSPGQLNKLLNPKSLPAFVALGGLRGIERGLQTNVKTGLSVDEASVHERVSFQEATGHKEASFSTTADAKPAAAASAASAATAAHHADGSDDAFNDRIRVYGKNILPPKKATPLWKIMWATYNDKVIILLTVAAAISLALGLYETFGVQHDPAEGQPVDWVEGVAIIVAIVIVTLVGSLNDWQKERAFVKLNAKKEDRDIKVIRSGKSVIINVADILVGDVIHLEPGDLVPVDGIVIGGHDLKCDESSATGESDALKKTGGEAVFNAVQSGHHPSSRDLDPFIISGAKVLEGVGTFVCTSVGTNSSFGKIMMSVRTEMEPTPLQKKLEGLAGAIAKLGIAAASVLFVVLLVRFLAGLPGDVRTSAEKASTFMDILIVAVTIIVVAVPEGLPLAVTLALAFATTRLLKENNLVRVLRACETMGNATTVCSDKTGTLTTNKMTVVAGTFGSASFSKSSSSSPSSADDEKPAAAASGVAQFAQSLPEATKKLIVQSVAVNSTAFEGEEDGKAAFIGSKTETALLQFAKDHLGMRPLAETRANEDVVQMMPFDSGKKCMGAVIKLAGNDGYRLLVKGASEILLGYCSQKLNTSDLDLSVSALEQSDRRGLEATIDAYAKQSLRTIALIYGDFPQWPPRDVNATAEGHVVDLGDVLRDLVFAGVVGIQDPVRPGVPEAVAKATRAGVFVRMVTGDNAVTARAIATECGIFTEGGLIMEGPVFRTLSDAEMDEKLPRLQVLARSSPEDKRILVTRLKALGETVAVTGDGTNDAPALKAADVGFSMGISGTEVAKEASAIVLMDDNFTSIVTALKWGRAVNDAVQKFLQFQITVNITAVLLAFITAVSDPEMESVLTAVQLLWVNLIMDTFAALALATDPPTEKILDRPPQGKKAPLITVNMWKMIVGQAIFQLTATLVLHFAGNAIFGYSAADEAQQLELDSVIFNTFVWMQIFNELNNRRLDNRFNVLEGVHRNYFFIAINAVMVGAQVAIIHVGGRAFSITPGGISAAHWAVSIVIALFSLPVAVLIRLVPDALFERVARFVGRPVVVVYRALRAGLAGVGRAVRRVTKKKKKTAEVHESASTDEESGGGGSGGAPGSEKRDEQRTVVAPAIVISSQPEDTKVGE